MTDMTKVLNAYKGMTLRNAKVFLKDKMAVFLNNITGVRGSATAEDFPMEEKSELLRTLSAVSYAEENGFSIEAEDGYIETDKMLLRRFKVKRK